MRAHLILLALVSFASAEKTTFLFSTTEQCSKIQNAFQRATCEHTVSSGKLYRIEPGSIGAAEVKALQASTDLAAPKPAEFDTAHTISISGEDTTKTISISPRHDYPEAQENISSAAGSLRFIAVLSGISFALSIGSLVILLNKK